MKNILIVEDDHTIRMELQRLLESSGYGTVCLDKI